MSPQGTSTKLSNVEFAAVADSILQSQVSNNNLQRICNLHGLQRFINLNPSSRGSIPPRTMYDTMEAILGAVAEDGGDEALRAVCIGWDFLGMVARTMHGGSSWFGFVDHFLS